MSELNQSAVSNPRSIALSDTTFTPRFAYGEQAAVAEVTGTSDDTALGTGYVRFTDAEIPWTIQYDEVVLVIEGHLEVRTPTATFSAGPKDSIWLPKGTELTYVSRSALVFYAIHPSNWSDGSAS